MNLLSNLFKKAKLVALLLMSLFLLENIVAQQQNVQGAQTLQAHFRGKTKPLRDLVPMPGTDPAKRSLQKANKPKFTPPNFINWRRQPKVNMDAQPKEVDPVRQIDDLSKSSTLIEPTLVFEGISEAEGDAGVPDTNGDVSPEHYFQIVNASWFRIWNKEGIPLTPVTSANTIWSQINQQSFSDPLVLWDEEAGRWLLTDLANINVVLYGVSETSDPMGAWYLYTLNTPAFADYPKYGIWPNAYLLTINEGQGSYPVYVLNRQQMLAGAGTVDVQRIEIPGINGGFPSATPMDWNSPLSPPSDEIFVARLNDDAWGNGNASDQIEVWTINVDWDTPANSTASMLALPTAAYDSDGCSVGGGADFQCIPQPGTVQGIDGIMTVIMHNISYWNYGTHESAALTFSVDAGGDVAGIRWMELRREPGSDWTVYQEGTFSPNNDEHRFIGGIAINGKGDIGLAYSVSGENTFPSLRYTGRRAGDPLGEMTLDEFEFAEGTGVRSIDRFGDYAKMSVDPVDGSFWFTSEYVLADGSFSTKIVNFSLRRDTLDIGPISLDAPQDAPDLTNSEPVTATVRNLGLEPATNITVGYVFENGTPVSESAVIDTLQPDSIYTHTFGTTVDMSVVGEYQFQIFAKFAEDQNERNDTLRRVRRKLPRFDAGIVNIEGLDGVLCDSFTTAIISLENFGTENLTSVTIEYQLNSGATQNIDWTGNLPTGEVTTVNISLNPLVSGTNQLTINTLDPNGMTDEIPSNDGNARGFQVLLGGVEISFSLSLDFFSQETSWQLTDASSNILFSGGTYPGQPFETINEDWCVAEGACYTFTIFDSYGDGLQTPFGQNGSYNIQDDEGNVLASIINVNFGYQEDNVFCVQFPCNLAADFDVTPEGTSNSDDGAILISVTSGVSPFSFSIDGGATSQLNSLFENLGGGVYDVVVTDANGCVIEQEVTVETLVAANDQHREYSIKVFPNPSESGAFWLEVKGLKGLYPLLELQVVDAIGRPVLYETLNSVDGHHKGLVSLYNYPAGVYYIRIKDEKINELVKIVRL